MNKREKEVQQAYLNNEKAVLKKLEENYKDALGEINSKIELLMARQDADMQHVIYQVEYQKALKTQVQAILETLQANEFETLSEYLTKSYEDGFIGTMYNLQGQGIPLVFPIDQEQVVAAIQHETKLSEPLYTALGKDVADLRKKIAGEISRGISSGQMYNEIARNIAGWAMIPKNNAMRIARTEAHRIQCKASMNACYKAKEKGADVVKQWDSSLDGKTRATHRELDGQIRELDEPFEVAGMKAMQPGDFGDPGEDCNCRCALLQRARWALGNDYTKWSADAPVVIDDDGTTQFTIIEAKNYEDFQKKYKQASERVRENVQKMKPTNKYGEEIQFDFKSNDEKREQQKQIITELSNQYDTRLQKVTFGAKNAAGDVDMSGATMRLNASQANVAIHEFAHTLANTSADKYGLTNDQDFWKEIRKIRTAYRKDVGNDTKRQISSYADSGNVLDEFMAEAFTQAKMYELGLELPERYGSDLTYSKQVLGVVDKYFKKKSLENSVRSSIIKSKEAPTINNARIQATKEDFAKKLSNSKGSEKHVSTMMLYDENTEYMLDESIGSAFRYDSIKDAIRYNPKAPNYELYDLNYVQAHELSHRMDDIEYHSFDNQKFTEAIDLCKLRVQENANEIQEWFIDGGKYENDFAMSDIISALSNNQIIVPIGHSDEYWEDAGNVSTEIFANISAIDVLDDDAKDEFNSLLKELYEAYKEIVE